MQADPFDLWPEERAALRRPSRQPIADWCASHVVLPPSVSGTPGPWSPRFTPFLVEPLNSLADPRVQFLTLLASAQVGKTTLLLLYLLWCMSERPGPGLWVAPREADVAEIFEHRLREIMRASPKLQHLLSDRKSDNVAKLLATPSMKLWGAGASSARDLASRSIKTLLLDEVDKFGQWTQTEASPVALAIRRTETFRVERKIVLASTPTTRSGAIFQHWLGSDRREFHVPLPCCGTWQPLHFERVRWPEDLHDPARVERDDLARYACAACEAEIDDAQKRDAVARGLWVPASGRIEDGCVVDDEPPTSARGYRIHGLLSPWVTLSAAAADFMRCNGEPALLMDFRNSFQALPWEELAAERTTAEHVERLIGAVPRNALPEDVERLTVGVDVGGTDADPVFHYVLVGWAPEERGYVIDCGRLGSFEAIENELLLREWTRADGQPLRVRLLLIDSGWRTAMVYSWAARWRDRVRPCKGSRTLGGVPWKSTRVTRTTSGRVSQFGIDLRHVDVEHFKDMLLRWCIVAPTRLALPADAPDELLRALTSEHKVLVRNRARGTAREAWVRRTGGGPNHLWDCLCYGTAAAHMVGALAVRRDRRRAAAARPAGAPPNASTEQQERRAAAASANKPFAAAVEEARRRARRQQSAPGGWSSPSSGWRTFGR